MIGLNATVSIQHSLFTVMLSVLILNVFMVSVVAALEIVRLSLNERICVIMLSVILLSSMAPLEIVFVNSN
jgi:hypothetical protein